MKRLRTQSSARAAGGFTLTEVMIVSALLMLILGGVVSGHVFGMRLYEITRAKLGATDESRHAISTLISDIRSAKIVRVGHGGANSFQEIADGQAQRGSALQIYASTNTNTFVRYFWDAADKTLKRLEDNPASAFVLASSVSNQVIFASEDFNGTVLTNNENNRVIGVTLQFYQIQYPITEIGEGHHYDFYQLRTKVTRRALE